MIAGCHAKVRSQSQMVLLVWYVQSINYLLQRRLLCLVLIMHTMHMHMQVPLSSLRTCTYALLYAEGLVQLLSKGTVCSCQAVMLQAGLI